MVRKGLCWEAASELRPEEEEDPATLSPEEGGSQEGTEAWRWGRDGGALWEAPREVVSPEVCLED